MDEYIELLTPEGKPSGNKFLKSIAHENGYFHASVHLWFYTESKELLIQKRKEDKDTFPSLWDISVAGHISFKETPIKAVLREVEEEIGLHITENDLKYLGTSEHKNKHPNNIIDHELHHIYLCKLTTSIKELTIQTEEVAAIKLISIQDLELALLSETHRTKFVPHGKSYYTRIFEATNKLIKES